MGGFVMKKMRKAICILLTCLLTLGILSGCSSGSNSGTGTTSAQTTDSEKKTEEKTVNFPTKPITIIAPNSAGGATDLGARLLAPVLEKELGVPVNVVNKPGAGGWVGWTEYLGGNNTDGYNVIFLMSPNLASGYLDPQGGRNVSLDDFAPIGNQVIDYGAIAINPKETRFTNIQELLEYAKKNEVTGSISGMYGDDHIALEKVNKASGTKFTAVNFSSGADGVTAVMRGHVDVCFSNIGDLLRAHNNGELKIIAVMSPERSDFVPDVPTLKEAGCNVENASARGIAAKAGTDPEIIKILADAMEKACKDPEHIAKMKEMGLAVVFLRENEYRAKLLEDEQGIRDIADSLGWDLK